MGFVRLNQNNTASGTQLDTTIDVTSANGNRLLVIGVGGIVSGAGTVVIDPGGGDQASATQLWAAGPASSVLFAWMFYIKEADLPASGTFTVRWTPSGGIGDECAIGVLLYDLIDQASTFGTPVTADNDSTDPFTSSAVSGAVGDIGLDAHYCGRNSATPSQTDRIAQAPPPGTEGSFHMSELTFDAATETFTWDLGATGVTNAKAWGGVAIKPLTAPVYEQSDYRFFNDDSQGGLGEAA